MCLLTGLLPGQRTGAMWLVAGAGQNDEGRGERLQGTNGLYLSKLNQLKTETCTRSFIADAH